MKNWSQNICIATEIASISVFFVFVAKLLVLPVWDTVYAFGLYAMQFCIV